MRFDFDALEQYSMDNDVEVAVLSVIRAAIEHGTISLTQSEEAEVLRRLLDKLLETRSGTEILVLASVLDQFNLTSLSREVISIYEANEAKFRGTTSPRLRKAMTDRMVERLSTQTIREEEQDSASEGLEVIRSKLSRMLMCRQKPGKSLVSLGSETGVTDKSPVSAYLRARRNEELVDAVGGAVVEGTSTPSVNTVVASSFGGTAAPTPQPMDFSKGRSVVCTVNEKPLPVSKGQSAVTSVTESGKGQNVVSSGEASVATTKGQVVGPSKGASVLPTKEQPVVSSKGQSAGVPPKGPSAATPTVEQFLQGHEVVGRYERLGSRWQSTLAEWERRASDELDKVIGDRISFDQQAILPR